MWGTLPVRRLFKVWGTLPVRQLFKVWGTLPVRRLFKVWGTLPVRRLFKVWGTLPVRRLFKVWGTLPVRRLFKVWGTLPVRRLFKVWGTRLRALYSKCCSRTFENVQNPRSRRHGDIIIWTGHVEYIRVIGTGSSPLSAHLGGSLLFLMEDLQ